MILIKIFNEIINNRNNINNRDLLIIVNFITNIYFVAQYCILIPCTIMLMQKKENVALIEVFIEVINNTEI